MSFHNLNANLLSGGEQSFDAYKDQVCLIVNLASE